VPHELIEKLRSSCAAKGGPSRTLFDAILDSEVRALTPTVSGPPELDDWERSSRDVLFAQLVSICRERPAVEATHVERFLVRSARESAGWRLLALWRQRDEAAASRFIEIFTPFLRNFVRALLGHHADFDDVVLLVWASFFERIPRLDPSRDQLYEFIRTLARNTILGHLRKKAPARDLDEGDLADEASRSPSEESRIDLRRGLGTLTDEDRDLIDQYANFGRTIGEIAASRGISPSTVYRQLARARYLLRRAMQGDKEPSSTQPDSNVRFTAYVPALIIPTIAESLCEYETNTD